MVQDIWNSSASSRSAFSVSSRLLHRYPFFSIALVIRKFLPSSLSHTVIQVRHDVYNTALPPHRVNSDMTYGSLRDKTTLYLSFANHYQLYGNRVRNCKWRSMYSVSKYIPHALKYVQERKVVAMPGTAKRNIARTIIAPHECENARLD
jgi:hypothetical protein